VDDLDSVLDSIELSAMQGECIYQVDLFPADLRSGDPLMIQFLIGHPDRSSLLWHDDGATSFAVEGRMALLDYILHCERLGSRDDVEPNLTMVTPATVRNILILFVLTNERPENVVWIEAEAD
jgi:Immunity protein Imm1